MIDQNHQHVKKLQELGSWNNFLRNMNKIRRFKKEESIMKVINQTSDFERLIHYAFVWANTPEGHRYWNSISKS